MKKILGIGNALVDILVPINSDELLNKLQFPKGSMQLIDEKQLYSIMELIKDKKQQMVSGGSAANTITGLANLNARTGFIGKTGDDETGNFFKRDMEQNNIDAMLLKSKKHSGCCIALISQDGERTMCTHLGAAADLQPADISAKLFKEYELLHIEGYLLQNHDLMEKTATLAKAAGLKISLDLASYNVVEDNIDFLRPFINNYIDIVFANEKEAETFAGKPAREALNELASICSTAIVKIGKKGSLIQQGRQIYAINAPVVEAIDTTGAGDLFASGFLYGLINGLDLPQCGQIGALTARCIIQTIGAKIKQEHWARIKQEIKPFFQ